MTDTQDPPELGPQEQGPAPRLRPLFTPEGLTSALALTISIFALAVSLFEANTQRVQQRASVWPYVELNQRYTSEGYTIEITNKGIGPARIQSVEVQLDGQSITSLEDMIVDAIGTQNAFSYDVYRSSNPSGGVMSAGESSQLFAVDWEDRTRLLAAAFNARGGVTACYCSIFDECWQATLGSSQPPAEVQRCERN